METIGKSMLFVKHEYMILQINIYHQNTTYKDNRQTSQAQRLAKTQNKHVSYSPFFKYKKLHACTASLVQILRRNVIPKNYSFLILASRNHSWISSTPMEVGSPYSESVETMKTLILPSEALRLMTSN